MNGIVHQFQERLEYSAALSNEPAWVAFHRALWPDALLIDRLDANSKWQKDGVDRRVTLPGGKDIYIDEKKRSGTFADVLLEEWSVYYGPRHRRNKVGWALDPSKRCDYVAYAVVALKKCYLLPFEVLRFTFEANLEAWKRRRYWYPKVSRNEGYNTVNCAVPWPVLAAAMNAQMERQFEGGKLALPTPVQEGQQLTFEHFSEPPDLPF